MKAKPTISCAQAEQIAQHGSHVDGDDGARFRLYGREWQCVVIARPHRQRWTVFGCFTPWAPLNIQFPQYKRLALVTDEIFEPAD